MLTTFLMGHWILLTWMTLGLDYSVWGMNPFGYHLTFVLILLDAYPLGRLGGRWRDWLAPHARPVWKEKVKLPLPSRAAATLWSFWFYVRKTLFPLDLSPLYELPGAVNPLAPQFVGGTIAVGILTGGFWLLRGPSRSNRTPRCRASGWRARI